MKRVATLSRLVAALGGLAALGGCLDLAKPSVDKRFYVIGADRASAGDGAGSAAPAAARPSLTLERVRVGALYDGEEFTYRTNDHGYTSDFYNEFFAPANLLIAQETEAWLARSGLFSNVVDNGAVLNTDYYLEGALAAIEGDYRDPAAPKAVLEIQFLLTDAPGSRARVLLQEDFRESVEILEATPDALVGGWNAALAKILERLERSLRDLRLAPLD